MEEFLSTFEKDDKGLFKLYDRFSFDKFFRVLLENDFDCEEALGFILCYCSLSALVFQERIYNKYYLNISTEETVSADLRDLANQILSSFIGKTLNIKKPHYLSKGGQEEGNL